MRVPGGDDIDQFSRQLTRDLEYLRHLIARAQVSGPVERRASTTCMCQDYKRPSLLENEVLSLHG